MDLPYRTFEPLGELARYRCKNRGVRIWHRCRNCSQWPVTDFEEAWEVPAGDQVCIKCVARLEANDCVEVDRE
jgi:hypothetical protein